MAETLTARQVPHTVGLEEPLGTIMPQLCTNSRRTRLVEQLICVNPEPQSRGPRSIGDVKEERHRAIRERELAKGKLVEHELDGSIRGIIRGITSDGKIYLKGRREHYNPDVIRIV